MEQPLENLTKALENLWDTVNSQLYHPKNWFKLKKIKRRFDLNFILYQNIKIMIPKGRLPDCENCLEICCTGPNSIVSLRLKDIAALIDVGLEKHITHERISSPFSDYKITEAKKNFAQSVFAQAFPVLSQDKTGTCTLLDEERMCSAYPAWPLSCARYPFSIDAINSVIFYAKGCGYFEQKHPDEVSGRTRNLIKATIDSYNERIKDILIIYFAKPELEKLGLAQYLRLEYFN